MLREYSAKNCSLYACQSNRILDRYIYPHLKFIHFDEMDFFSYTAFLILNTDVPSECLSNPTNSTSSTPTAHTQKKNRNSNYAIRLDSEQLVSLAQHTWWRKMGFDRAQLFINMDETHIFTNKMRRP